MMVAVSAFGCSGSSEAPTSPKVLNLQSSDASQRAAIDGLVAIMRTRVPDLEVTLLDAQGCSASKCGQQPDIFQAIGGGDLREWAASGKLRSLDELAAAEGWHSTFSGAVLNAMSGADGQLYGVPLTLERDNTLFFNRNVFSSNLTPPSSVADWFMTADTLQASGRAPLAVSGSGGWTIASQLFEGLLVQEAGVDFYSAYFSGTEAGDAPEIKQALTDLAKMMNYANADRASIGWADAVQRVCLGQAAMVFMPDFADGQFGLFGCGATLVGYVALQPAASPSFVYATTGFGTTLDAPHPDMALEFLRAAGSREGQAAYVSAMGGVPARADLDPSKFDALADQSLQDFNSPSSQIVPGYALLASSAFQTAISPALQQFVDPTSPDYQNVDTMLAALRNAYPTIKP
jgi:glucose/mannose transport system substrate-binding protein